MHEVNDYSAQYFPARISRISMENYGILYLVFHAIPIENPFICNTSVYKYITCECKGF